MKQLFKTIDRTEKKVVVLVIIILIFVSIAPTIFGLITAPDNQALTGVNFLSSGDISVYYSYIEQAKNGQIFQKDLYTAESQVGFIFNPLWLLGGIIGSLFSLSGVVVFHLLKILLIPVFVWIVYLLIAYLNHHKKIRKLALLMISFSSGISAYLSPWFNQIVYRDEGYLHFPMDLWAPESNTFMTLFYNPLFIFSQILLVLTFLFFLMANDKNKFSYAVWSGLSCLLLILIHPFMVTVVFWVLVVYWFVKAIISRKIFSKVLMNIIIVFGLTLPAMAYYLFLFENHSVFRLQSEQNVNLTPAWWMIFFSYGFLIVLFLVNLYANRKRIDQRYLFPLVWFLGQLCLLWSPLFFQRRLSEGLHLPLAYLAALGLWFIYQKVIKSDNKNINWLIVDNRIIWILAFIIFLGFSNILMVAEGFKKYAAKESAYLYQDKSAIALYDWLGGTDREAVILARYPYNNFIPGYSARTVYWGHKIGTIDYTNKRAEAEWFYQPGPVEAKTDFLQSKMIDLVVLTKVDDNFLGQSNLVELVYSNDNFLVYQLI